MGDEFLAEARRKIPLVHDYEVMRFVREIGGRLVETLGEQPFEYEFFVVRADDINAFAVPGGKIFFNAGLIARVGSEDELAGVVGHEIAHSHAHHVVRQQQKSAPANYATLLSILLTVIHPALGAAGLTAANAASLKYQRDFEREADYLGVGYAAKAGFEDEAIMHLLRKLYSEQQLNPTLMPPYLFSHPLTGERLANLEAVLRNNEWTGRELTASHRLRRAAAIVRGLAQRREQVVPDFERRLAAASEAERPEAVELMGIMMAHGEDYALARGYLEEAEKLGRNVDRELGRTYARLGMGEKALPYLQRAVAAQPEDWNACADLGLVRYHNGDYAGAAESLKSSIELYPYITEVTRTLGRALGADGKEGEGFYYFGKASELEGRLEQAVGYYRKALAALPADSELKTELSERMGELEEEVESSRPPTMPRKRGEPPPSGGGERKSFPY